MPGTDSLLCICLAEHDLCCSVTSVCYLLLSFVSRDHVSALTSHGSLCCSRDCKLYFRNSEFSSFSFIPVFLFRTEVWVSTSQCSLFRHCFLDLAVSQWPLPKILSPLCGAHSGVWEQSYLSISASRIEIRALGSMEHRAVGCRLCIAELQFGFSVWLGCSQLELSLWQRCSWVGISQFGVAVCQSSSYLMGGSRLGLGVWWETPILCSLVGKLPAGVRCVSVTLSFGGRLPDGICCMVGSSHLGFLGHSNLILLCGA